MVENELNTELEQQVDGSLPLRNLIVLVVNGAQMKLQDKNYKF